MPPSPVRPHTGHRWFKRVIHRGERPPPGKVLRLVIAGICCLPWLYSGNDRPTQLEQVRQRGSMVLLTRNGASSYFLGAEGPTGPEYDLVKQFADYLGVTLNIEVAETFDQLGGLLERGRGDLVAANLSRTDARERQFTFGPDYLQTRIVVVQRASGKDLSDLGELAGKKIMVLAGSSYEEALRAGRRDYPDLSWEPRNDVGIEDLLLAVSDAAIDVTLIDSNIFDANRSFYPELEVGLTLPASVPHAWAFPHGADDSLAQEARVFMRQSRESGSLAAVLDHYYRDQRPLDSMNMVHFLQQVRDRLPHLLAAFRQAGEIHGIDWRLLAAVGYQESLWDPEAASHTGVRGIMMLTEQTALQLGVDDRRDPWQSIEGGAKYLVRLRQRLPQHIAEPDRTWMALAAYNMGMGHLRDARILAQKQGLNPDEWSDISHSLDLLSQEKWHSQTRYGYARGPEARRFVANIRRYYETLIWMDTREHPLLIAGLR